MIAYLYDNLNNVILFGIELWNILVFVRDLRCFYECVLNIVI